MRFIFLELQVFRKRKDSPFEEPILLQKQIRLTGLPTGNSNCLYVYESVSKKVVIDNCYKNWTSAVGDIVAAAKNVVQAALSEADWLATIAIWGVIIVVIADLVIPMDPVPIIPLSDPTLVEY